MKFTLRTDVLVFVKFTLIYMFLVHLYLARSLMMPNEHIPAKKRTFQFVSLSSIYIVKPHIWLPASSPKLPIEYAVDMTCVDRILFCSAHVTFITSLWQKGDAIHK